MNTLRTLRYAHYADMFNPKESYRERLKRINHIVLVFAKELENELLFYNGWVGYGKE